MEIITMARPKTNIIKLTDDDVKSLKKILKKKDTNQILSARCRILINLDENHPPAMTYDQCMSSSNVSRATIAKTVKLFASGGIDEVLKINRNINSDHARRKVDGRTEAKIIEIACGPVPDGHARWTIRLLEDRMKMELDEPISREAIRRALKKTNFDLTVATTGVSQTEQTQNS